MSLATELTPTARGKVRDLYDLGDTLLFVASDRISAFDFVLQSEIPYKGEVLTQLSLFWFEQLADVVPNHLLSAQTEDLPAPFSAYAHELAGRFMLVRKAQMFPVECIVRGYLAGSGLAEYERSGTVCGLTLPAGLQNSSRLDEPLYTPSTKAELGNHDENISFERSAELLGLDNANALRSLSLAVYTRARDIAAKRGIIIADTKFEFGRIGNGRSGGNNSGNNSGNTLILADEVLTPDSSRFWPAEDYAPGASQLSFDKQFVRDWLTAHWDKAAAPQCPPPLPPDIIAQTSIRYRQAYELLTGKPFVPAADLLL